MGGSEGWSNWGEEGGRWTVFEWGVWIGGGWKGGWGMLDGEEEASRCGVHGGCGE